MKRLTWIVPALLAACAVPDPRPVEPDQTVASLAPTAPEAAERPEFVGIVTTRKAEIVPSPFEGKVLKVDMKPNARIKKGEQLVKLDDADLKDQIKASIADERAGNAQAGADGAIARQARDEASRMQRGRKAFSGMAIQGKFAEAKSAAARAGVGASQAQAARARREPLERQLTQSSIVAPFDGVVMAIKAKEGQIARKDEPLARIFDPSDLLFRFAVPKEWRKTVAVGSRVQLQIDGVDHPMWATIETITDQEAPIDFAVVVADIDDSKLAPGEIEITSSGRVTLADNKPSARKAVR